MPSFDIVSKVDLQTLDNAVNTASKEIKNRFDFKGNHVVIDLNKKEFNEQGFERLLKKIKKAGKNRRYDCVVGISGGVDSSYLAYLLKKNGLRILLVHMDNGWNSEESVRNIKAVADALPADYEAYVLDWEEFKDLQKSFLKASVVEAETPTDMAILSVLHIIAARHGVKYIASGDLLAPVL